MEEETKEGKGTEDRKKSRGNDGRGERRREEREEGPEEEQ